MKHPAGNGTVFLLCMVFLVCACNMSGSQASSYAAAGAQMKSGTPGLAYDNSTHWEGAGFNPEVPAGAEQEAPHAPAPSAEEQTRKLVKRAQLRLRVEDPAAAEKPLAELMEKYGAWPASTRVYENSRDYSIRVPSLCYDAMLADLAGLGKTLRRTESAEDVTLRYYDLEGRLAVKRELLKTYQGYLAKAKNIDEIMTVESRIADLQQEIDWTGTQLRNLAGLIDYSTIDLEITGPASASSYSEPTLGEKLGELFGSFADVASSALVVLMGIVIYGIPAILILILLFWILFGRIGLIKKIWRLAAGKKTVSQRGDKPAAVPTPES